MTHTLQQDFEHFLSYSGLASESEDVRAKLLKAYAANWRPRPESLQSAKQIWDIAVQFAGIQINDDGVLVFETPEAFADCLRDVFYSLLAQTVKEIK